MLDHSISFIRVEGQAELALVAAKVIAHEIGILSIHAYSTGPRSLIKDPWRGRLSPGPISEAAHAFFKAQNQTPRCAEDPSLSAAISWSVAGPVRRWMGMCQDVQTRSKACRMWIRTCCAKLVADAILEIHLAESKKST